MSLKGAQKQVDIWRRRDEKIVTVNGSFDLMHPGHVFFLQEAKKYGDRLVVGLNSDVSYRKYKDRSGPLFSQVNRAIIVSALEDVDLVVVFDEADPGEFLKAIKPEIHCNGSEYGADCLESKILPGWGGKLQLLPRLKDRALDSATTDVVARITKRKSSELIRAFFIDWYSLIDSNPANDKIMGKFKASAGQVATLKRLAQLKFALIIVGNKSDITHKHLSIHKLELWQQKLVSYYHGKGIIFLDYYSCTHNPKLTICDCHMPGSALFRKAAKEHHLNLSMSWALMSTPDHCLAAKRISLKTILLKSPRVPVKPKNKLIFDYFVEDFDQIVKIRFN